MKYFQELLSFICLKYMYNYYCCPFHITSIASPFTVHILVIERSSRAGYHSPCPLAATIQQRGATAARCHRSSTRRPALPAMEAATLDVLREREHITL